MTWYKCSECGYTFQVAEGGDLPETCPRCSQSCTFKNVTDYTKPGEPEQIDPRL